MKKLQKYIYINMCDDNECSTLMITVYGDDKDLKMLKYDAILDDVSGVVSKEFVIDELDDIKDLVNNTSINSMKSDFLIYINDILENLELETDIKKEAMKVFYEINVDYDTDAIDKYYIKMNLGETKEDNYTVMSRINKDEIANIISGCSNIEYEKSTLIGFLTDYDIYFNGDLYKESKGETIFDSLNSCYNFTQKNSVLDKYAINMNKHAKNNVYIREEETKKLVVDLYSSSAIIIGEAGVGKTSIVDGLVTLINSNNVPDYLKGKTIYKLNSSSIVSGCTLVGMLEERLESILKEVMQRDDVILFIDEVHTLMTSGKGNKETSDIANILKPYLDNDKIKIIGATTKDEYYNFIEKDQAFKRRFEIVEIKEPNKELIKKIIYKVIEDEKEKSNISFEQYDLIDRIIDMTEKSHRNYFDSVVNPYLSKSIITKSFSYAAYYNSNEVKLEHIIEAISSIDRISDYTRRNTINKLMVKKPKQKCQIIEFRK